MEAEGSEVLRDSGANRLNRLTSAKEYYPDYPGRQRAGQKLSNYERKHCSHWQNLLSNLIKMNSFKAVSVSFPAHPNLTAQ